MCGLTMTDVYGCSPSTIQVLGFFKEIVLKAYKDEERTNTSKWIQGKLSLFISLRVYVLSPTLQKSRMI